MSRGLVRLDSLDPLHLSEGGPRPFRLPELESMAVQQYACDARRHTRIPFHVTGGIIFRVTHPGASDAVSYRVAPRNISESGIGFFHGGFLYNGTKCTVELTALDGQIVHVPATVKRCRHVRGVVHEVGVEFETEIHLSEYVKDVPESEEINANAAPTRLAGRILYVDPSVDGCELFQFLILCCGAESQCATTAAEARKRCIDSPFDLLMIDPDLPDQPGVEVIQAVKAGGFNGPMVCVSAPDGAVAAANMIAAGCVTVLHKPLTRQALLSGLIPILNKNPADHLPELLYSSLWEDADMQPLIIRFIDRMNTHLHDLEHVIAQKDVNEFQRICRDIRGVAGGYGFAPLAATATSLSQQKITQTTEEATKMLDTLKQLVAAARKACAAESKALSKTPYK